MDIFKNYEVYIKGTSALIMHSDKFCDPLNEENQEFKKISSLKKKTVDHYNAMSYLEWKASLYYDEEIGIYVSSKSIQGSIRSAARKNRKGTQTKGIILESEIGYPLIGYEKHDPDSLWKIVDEKGKRKHVFKESVVVPIGKRVMRTRAIFRKWQLKFRLSLNIDILPYEDLENSLIIAGYESGLGELRPQKAIGNYGRFMVEEIKEL